MYKLFPETVVYAKKLIIILRVIHQSCVTFMTPWMGHTPFWQKWFLKPRQYKAVPFNLVRFHKINFKNNFLPGENNTNNIENINKVLKFILLWLGQSEIELLQRKEALIKNTCSEHFSNKEWVIYLGANWKSNEYYCWLNLSGIA